MKEKRERALLAESSLSSTERIRTDSDGSRYRERNRTESEGSRDRNRFLGDLTPSKKRPLSTSGGARGKAAIAGSSSATAQAEDTVEPGNKNEVILNLH